MAKLYTATYDNLTLNKLYLKKVQEGDYDGALSAIRRMQENGESKEVLSSLYATTYYNMGMYHEAVESWFNYLSVCPKNKCVRAYNGLGASFFRLNDLNNAGYYFNLQVTSKSKQVYPYDDVVKEFYQEVVDVKNAYYVAYPYESADFSKLIAKCYDLIKFNEYEKVIKNLEIVPEKSKFYSEALMQKAIAYFFLEDYETAVTCIETSVKTDDKNTTAICNAVSICKATKNKQKAEYYVEMLRNSMPINSEEARVKAVMVFEDFGDYKTAKQLALMQLKEKPYDVNTIYILAFLEYNLNNVESARNYFLNHFRLTKNYVSKYYANFCAKKLAKLQSGKRLKKLEFMFDLPSEEKIAIYEKLTALKNKKSFKITDEFLSVCEFCMGSAINKLSYLAVELLFRSNCQKSNEFLRNALLLTSTYDDVKKAIISCFLLDGYEGEMSVVFGGKFKKFNLDKVVFYGENGGVFQSAYAIMVSEVCAFCEDFTRLKDAAYEVYGALVFNGKESEVEDEYALSALMFEVSKTIEDINKVELAKFFKTSTKAIKKVRDLYLSCIAPSEEVETLNYLTDDSLSEEIIKEIKDIYDE